jgi:hypothetical protein
MAIHPLRDFRGGDLGRVLDLPIPEEGIEPGFLLGRPGGRDSPKGLQGEEVIEQFPDPIPFPDPLCGIRKDLHGPVDRVRFIFTTSRNSAPYSVVVEAEPPLPTSFVESLHGRVTEVFGACDQERVTDAEK